MQILIRFPDKQTEQLALGKLIPRFFGKSWSAGELSVPSMALGFLANEGISFTVISRTVPDAWLEERAARATGRGVKEFLAKVPNVEPPEWDRLPEGYEPRK